MSAEMEEECARLRTQVEGLLHRMTSEEAAGEIERLRAEVARLEGLIVVWYESPDDNPSWDALVAEARRIREREGRK